MQHSAKEFVREGSQANPATLALFRSIAGSDGTVVEPFCTSALAKLARALVNARAHRRQFFKSTLFSEPAWDILLELLAADCEGRRCSISSAGLTANIPTTTALRWINTLEHEGLIRREDDPLDRRRSFLILTDDGRSALKRYFESCQRRYWL